MKRRSFFRMLAGLACVPLLPKAAAQKAPNLEFTVQGLDGPVGPWTACTPYQPGDVIASGGGSAACLESPVGTLAAFVGNSAPKGWYMCDGTEIKREECSQLAEMLPEFKLPDLKGFVIKADLSS